MTRGSHMRKSEVKFGIRITFILSLAAFAVIASAWAPQPLHATNVQSSSQPQSASAQLPDFEYDVVSIKPTPEPDFSSARVIPIGILYSPDGMDAKGMRLWGLLVNAYGVQIPGVIGAPEWA